MNEEREIIHVTWAECDKVRLPRELLESLARSLVPDFQAYMWARQEQERSEDNNPN